MTGGVKANLNRERMRYPEFDAWKRVRGVRFARAEGALRTLLRSAGDRQLKDVTPKQISTYLDGSRMSAYTWWREYQIIRSFFQFWLSRNKLARLPNLQPQEIRPKPTIVEVDKTVGGITYKVDSKLTGSKPRDDLLHALNEVADRNGVNHPIYVFVNPRLPIDEIWNVNGVAGKTQLTNVRFFFFFRENQKMTEIKWTPFVPFSTNPSTN